MRNLKRALSMALAAIMVLGLMVVGASAAGYEDFTDKDEIQYTEAVNTMVSLGVISGKEDGSYYDPTGSLTRAEACTLIARMLGGGKDPVLGSNITSNFTDTKGHWAETYIAYCANLGIIVGVGDGSFNPDGVLTGTAAAKMVLCALGYKPEFEGIGGSNWELATNTLATKVKLYDGLEDMNPSETITRDQVAQLIYNGVQADEVEYRNLEGDYSGTLYAQPVNGVNNDSTMLLIRFRVVKVTGILEANDKVSVANGVTDANGNRVGHVFGTTALDGKSLLRVTNVAGKSTVNYSNLMGAQTFTVDTPDEMVGQEIVLYVQFQNELAPNASQSTVIGSPIITDNNTVVETSTKLGDDAAVRSALRAGGMTNIGTPTAFLYTENDVQLGVVSGITNDITAKVRSTETGRSAGIFQRFIDNDGDGYPNYIVQIVPVLSSVNSVNTDSTKYTFTGISGTIDSDDIVTDETLVRNDVVLVTKYADDCYYISYPETVEGTVESYNSNNNTVSVDGNSYANSGGKNLVVTAGQEQILTEEMVDGSYIFYLDPYGNVLGALETEGVVGNYAVVQGWNRTGNDTMGYSVSVKLLMQDGTTGTYNLNLAATAVRLGVASATDSTTTKEDAITTVNEEYFGDPANYGKPGMNDGKYVVDHLFSYTLDGNTVTLSYPQEINDDRYMSSNWNTTLVEDDSLTSGATVNKNVATYNLTKSGTSIVANDQTVFFIKDNQGDYYVVTGLANLPSTTKNGGTDVAGIPVNGTNSDTIAYQAPGSSTWMARAVFLETTNTFESVRDFVFVTDKWVTKNVSGSPVYTFTVVNEDGEVSQLTTTQDANTLKETVREWNYDGSYVEFHDGNGTFTHHNAYISEIEGNVITLSDVDTGSVIGSYRVDGAAKIWDVQDDPVNDKLQVNDIVGVYLDSENIVTAAFIYDVMNGAYADLPSSITLGGVALTSGATTVNATANEKLSLVVTVPTDVTLDHIYLDNSEISMTKSGNTYTGSYTATTDKTLTVKVVVSQSGRDTYTYTYTGTFDVTVGGAPAGSGNINAATGSEQVIANVDDDTKVISLKNATDGNASLTLSFLLNQALTGAEGVYTQSLGMYAEVPSGSMSTPITNANVGDYFFKSGDVYYSLAFAKADALDIAADTAAQATDGKTFVYTLNAAPDVNAVSNTTVKVYDAASAGSEVTTDSVAYNAGNKQLTITLQTALDSSTPTKDLYVEVQGHSGNSDRVKLVANFEPAALTGSNLTSASTSDGSNANVTIDNYNSGSTSGFSLKVYTDAEATQLAEGVTATFNSATQVDFAGLNIESGGNATYYVTVVVDANNTVESTPATITISRA